MRDTLLIWFNPDSQFYEVGHYLDFKTTSSGSRNEDRFEVIHEFSSETVGVANKILNSLNKLRTNPQMLNF
ncbi:hypothetical protein [Ekhidna sp.]|uniref:hypothetical protein n=1 Tax=Ekhidna sp. TaxID=2608089 RepID=UPI00351955AE